MLNNFYRPVQKPAKKSLRSTSLKQMLMTWELDEASEVIPHLISTATKWTPYWLQKCCIWGKYFLVNSSLSPSIPPNGEEKNIRHVLGSFNFNSAMYMYFVLTDFRVRRINTILHRRHVYTNCLDGGLKCKHYRGLKRWDTWHYKFFL